MTVLYLCYQSLLEPLTQTQVVAYLEGLAKKGYGIVLLTFEPRPLTVIEARTHHDRLLAKNIDWLWLRYHKHPTVPATAWDILAGIVAGWRLDRKRHLRLIHARSHVPGIMALVLKWLTGAQFLFDIRGFMAEEYADAGLWSENGLLFRAIKWVERVLVKAADGIVVLTHAAEHQIRQWYPRELGDKPVQVIPCCVNSRHGLPVLVSDDEQEKSKTIIYVGKLDGWYATTEMVAFIAKARELIPGLHWQVWTQSDPVHLRELIPLYGLENMVSIGSIAPEELISELAKAHAGLALYKRNLSGASCSPTKIGEYLAAGLPVVANMGIGDVDTLLTGAQNGNGLPVGILLKEFSEDGYRRAAGELLNLLQDSTIRPRCQSVAQDQFDLVAIGWVRYCQIYERLLGGDVR